MEYLAQNSLKGTIFAVGSRVLYNPRLLQAQYLAGHQIGVHTWCGRPFTRLPARRLTPRRAQGAPAPDEHDDAAGRRRARLEPADHPGRARRYAQLHAPAVRRHRVRAAPPAARAACMLTRAQ
jgi:peptidoglycan/xylan/chitin deacetylase (PgdA/CDA1 family)